MKTVEDYLCTFEGTILDRMKEVRALILSLAPEAEESISYGMPAYKFKKKPLVYFGGFTHHIGVYGTPDCHKAFEEEFKQYLHGKGSVQFPHHQDLPIELIKSAIQFRMEQINSISK
jgi:uncharacterized protein YdhG (YjbR/CyaY superfamily)